ncbi:winged helix-turn-helix domain-containing protein [Methanothrix soehngenii]|jgi:hypothetical protein|uniref:winged helix-turn-helix domain-containing protein n=1 Tax=Methanothrix soehngenii TaxID=2223 RepID=UPI0023F4165B|nr:winged helix-turn-helix domain-containing protein [Methanothrix soehngenii]MCK9586040.1 winged helix-turn-helix domain-containing protein [Methanothrix soehngenii]MDD5256423.1 winged helix-turn-helix domain-containing protein [Methanothrix soehngenii]
MANETEKKPRSRKKRGMAEAGVAAVKSKRVTGKGGGMTEESVDLVFGINAGIIWDLLSLKGPMSARELAKSAALRIDDVHGALGWLGREGKINVNKKGRSRIYSLRP